MSIHIRSYSSQHVSEDKCTLPKFSASSVNSTVVLVATMSIPGHKHIYLHEQALCYGANIHGLHVYIYASVVYASV